MLPVLPFWPRLALAARIVLGRATVVRQTTDHWGPHTKVLILRVIER